MRNSNLRGAGTVFRYAVQQHYKTRSVIVFLAFLFVIAAAVLPVTALLAGGQKVSTETGIHTLYLRNETEFPVDASLLLENERYHDLKIQETDEDDEALKAHLTAEKDAASTVITMDAELFCFSISTFYGESSEVTHKDAATLNNALSPVLHSALLKVLSVTEAQEAVIHSEALSQVSKVSDYLRGAEETNADTHSFANTAYNFFVLLLCTLSMTYIFQLCMEEKTSKLVEMLMVSISPTALLIGKILAVTLFIFGGIALIAIGVVISVFITRQISDLETIKEIITSVLKINLSSMNLNGGTIILLILCVLLVYAIFASLSGIFGSCCSKTEDTQQASLAVMMILLVSYLLSSMAPNFESDGANVFFSIFPLTSVFNAFPNYICGKIGVPVLLLGLVIQAVTAVFLMRLAGTVYRMMLLYRGSFPKPKQFVQMLKDSRQSGRNTAGKEDSHAV